MSMLFAAFEGSQQLRVSRPRQQGWELVPEAVEKGVAGHIALTCGVGVNPRARVWVDPSHFAETCPLFRL